MERNEIDIFDELVRGKLSNYTEAPEPEWIRSIQAKKTRAVNLYHLYRLMIIAVIVGAGIFAGIQYTPQQPLRTQVSQPNQQKGKAATVKMGPSAVTKPSFIGEFASSDNRDAATINYSTISTTTYNTTNTSSGTNKTAGNHIQTTRVKSNQVTGPTTAQPKTTTEQSTEPLIKGATQTEPVPVETIKEETKEQPNENKDKAQTSSLPCKATFDYYTDYSGKFSFVQLAQLNDNATLNWDFGDGASGNQKTVSHGYERSGRYDVTLTITDEKSSCTLTKNIVYINPNDKTTPITLSGTVVAGSSILKNAPVELLKYDEEKGRFKSDQSFRTNQMGEYTITLQRNARYLIKGFPTSDAQHYAATFWGNTTESEDATEVMVMPSEQENLMGYTIQLQYDDQQTDITAEQTQTIPNTQPGTQQVFLVDGNNKIVSVGTVDGNGNYNFGPGVNAGDYKIVNPSNGSSANTSVTPGGSGLTGNQPGLAIPSEPSATNEEVVVYPNPASSTVTFGLNNDQSEVAIVVIMDASGVERSRQQVLINPGFNEAQYDISSFLPGIYYVMIFRNNKQVSSSRIVKLADSGRQ